MHIFCESWCSISIIDFPKMQLWFYLLPLEHDDDLPGRTDDLKQA